MAKKIATIPLLLLAMLLLFHTASATKRKVARMLIDVPGGSDHEQEQDEIVDDPCPANFTAQFQFLVDGGLPPTSSGRQRQLRDVDSSASAHRQLCSSDPAWCQTQCCGFPCTSCWIPLCCGCYDSGCRRRDLQGEGEGEDEDEDERELGIYTVIHKDECKVEFKHFKTALKWANDNAPTKECKDHVKETARLQCYMYDDGVGHNPDKDTCTIFQLGDSKVKLADDDETGVLGNICLTAGSKLEGNSDNNTITRSVYGEAGAEIDILFDAIKGAVEQPANLSEAKSFVYDLKGSIENAACTMKIRKDELKEGGELTTNRDVEVICFDDDVTIEKDLVIHGGSSQRIYFKFNGKFEFKARITADGLDDSRIFWYMTGQEEAKSNEYGYLPGTLINLYNKITVDKGHVTVSIISKFDIEVKGKVGRTIDQSWAGGEVADGGG